MKRMNKIIAAATALAQNVVTASEDVYQEDASRLNQIFRTLNVKGKVSADDVEAYSEGETTPGSMLIETALKQYLGDELYEAADEDGVNLDVAFVKFGKPTWAQNPRAAKALVRQFSGAAAQASFGGKEIESALQKALGLTRRDSMTDGKFIQLKDKAALQKAVDTLVANGFKKQKAPDAITMALWTKDGTEVSFFHVYGRAIGVTIA